MKINVLPKGTCAFTDLPVGKMFYDNDTFYLKIGSGFAFNFANNQIECYGGTEDVEPVLNAELTIYGNYGKEGNEE